MREDFDVIWKSFGAPAATRETIFLMNNVGKVVLPGIAPWRVRFSYGKREFFS